MVSERDSGDEIVLTSLGLDVGSSTSHAVFSRIRLRHLSQAGTMRYVPVARTVLWESPIVLTPYVAGNEIDSHDLSKFVDEQHRASGIERQAIDCGAVILTGTALLRRNARAITESLALESGQFVCATAGHDLEARLSAAGSGSLSHSRTTGESTLSIDIGGGTTKFAMIKDGDIIDTAALTVGSRLVAFDERRVLTRVEDAAIAVAGTSVGLRPGEALGSETEDRLVDQMTEAVVAMVRGGGHGLLGVSQVLAPTAWPWTPDVVRFSGGVAAYMYGAADADVGDLGWRLGARFRELIDQGELNPARVLGAGESIRATVIGASQFSVQVSGDTTTVSDVGVLPLRDVRVIRPSLQGSDDADTVAAAVATSLRQVVQDDEAFALAIRWDAPPVYRRVRALGEGIVRGLGGVLASDRPLVIALDGDLGLTLGRMLRRELHVPAPVVCIDGLRLDDFEFIDVGVPLRTSGSVPVVIKSLVFPAPAPG